MNENQQIHSQDTLELILSFGAKADVSMKKAFVEKIRQIEQVFLDHHITDGILVISKVFGFDYHTMPWGKTDEILSWARKNYFRHYQIVEPSIHAQLMETSNEYSKWFTEEERRHTPKATPILFAD